MIDSAPTFESVFVENIQSQTAALEAFLETQLQLSGRMDPLDKLIGSDSDTWTLINQVGFDSDENCSPFDSADDLKKVRRVCRAFWKEHPNAKCGHENRISYVIGTGHSYSVVAKQGEDIPQERLNDVQDIVDRFCKANNWKRRQAETLLRRDRDGEAFLRFFPQQDGIIRVRYIEPGAVHEPEGQETRPELSFGIQTEPDDIETVVAYWVNNEPIDADEVQHRKRGLDSSCKRGTPLFWATRHNLLRAGNILRNGSAITEIQTAIGMIRKFAKANADTVTAWTATQSNVKATSDTPGFGDNGTSSRYMQRFPPGTILNTSQNIDYDFPGMGVDPSRYIQSLQAELRAVAASLVMPEFMLTAKSDDQNRAAAFVAEGPSVKMFERLQSEEIEDDLEILDRQLDFSVVIRQLDPQLRNRIMIQVEAPRVTTRDRLAEAQIRQLDSTLGILSPQTASQRAELDYETEQDNLERHRERSGEMPVSVSVPELPPAEGEEDGE